MEDLAFRLETHDAVASTNEVVKRALEAGEPEGFAVAARVQTAGYGRQGRAWASPAGGMYVSVLLRPRVPVAQLPTLSLAAGVAARRALASLVAPAFADRIQVKWPNDVVLVSTGAMLASFRKLCGISLEFHAGGICIGIGVNVVPPAEGVRQVDGKNAPAYVVEIADGGDAAVAADAAQSPSIEEVRTSVLENLSLCYSAWVAGGLSSALEDLAAYDALLGRKIVVTNLDGSLLAQGVACGIDEAGRLLVRDAFGVAAAVSSGEAHIASIR